ncbi:MAG: response regulator [Nitrospirae bacterium]|nr:response regulator [Nitrospirota bacterium]
MNIFNSIKFRFTSGVFLLITIITVFLSMLSYDYEKKAIQERIYAQLNATADLKKELVVSYINERINDLKALAVAEDLRESVFAVLNKKASDMPETEQYKYIHQRLEPFKNIYQDYLSIEVTDLKGNIIVSTESSPAVSEHKHERKKWINKYIDIIKRGGTVIMQDYLNAGGRHLDFAVGVKDRDGNVRAIIISRISLKNTLFSVFSDYTGLGLTGENLLVKISEGNPVHINPTRHPPKYMKNAVAYSREHSNLGFKAASGNEGIGEAIDYRGKKVIGAYRYVPILRWGIVAKMDVDEAFKEITALRRRIAVFGILILGVMLAVTYLVVNRVTAPIVRLTQKTNAIASGDYSIRIESRKKDEVGDLERDFNKMVEVLNNSRIEVENKRKELEKINHELERKVLERTKELSDANAALLQALEDIKKETEDKKKLEAQLYHAQKMEAVGTLTGGIAHDFNNILTAIIGFGTLMRMDMRADDPNRTYLKEILNAGERAIQLTQGLLAFSRKQIINPKPVKLNEIIKGIEKLLKRILREDIKFKAILADEDLTVMADSGQAEQILMNLTTNARDAMPAGGILTIGTELVNLDNEFIKTHGYGGIGKYALISVSDTGIGMDDNTRERIFEPFFTTKELGKGTGLGLAVVYGIIKQHNGYINVYSEHGKGTTFRIYLPAIKSEFKEAEPAAPPALKRGTETVLIAEDDAAIRKLTKDMLEGSGYKVIEAVDGEDAVHKFVEDKDKIELLILDVVMPKKNGKEAYEEIRKINPDIKAVFLSGYTADIIHKKGILEEGLNFISKPVSPDEFLRKLREVLDK